MLSPLNRKILTAMFCCLICSQLYAYDVGPVEVHGFISAGYYRSFSNNAIDSDSKDGSIDFYEAALNYNYHSGRWFTMGQAISRDIGDAPVNEEKLALDYLLFGANIINRSNFDLQFRLGQIKTPYGIMDTSDIPTTRDYPLEGYASRNLFLRSRGIVFDAAYMSEIGDFDFNLGYLYPEIDVERAFDFGDSEFNVNHKPYFNSVLRLKWTSKDRDISVLYSTMSLRYDVQYSENEFGQTVYADIYCKGNKYHQLIASKIFEDFKLSVTLGTTKFDQDVKVRSSLGPIFYEGPLIRGRSNNYLVRGSYEFTPKLSSSLAFGYTKNVVGTNGRPYESDNQRLIQITMDYTFNQNWVIKSAFSHNDGTMNVSQRYNPDGIKEKWNLFEVQITYSF